MVTEIPATRTALVKTSPGQAAITTKSMPVLQPGYMLVQTKAVALNPADWTDIDYSGVTGVSPSIPDISPSQGRYEGCVTGLDYAGVVVRVEPVGLNPARSSALTAKEFNPGDRVCGCAYGCNALRPSDGAFADYIIVQMDLQMHIPDDMEFEDAASLGVGVLSAGMGLFHVGGLRIPPHLMDFTHFQQQDYDADDNQEWLLVYGGSTATGSIAIQFAKLAGYKVVTTCSPRNFELVKRLGADAVFDYKNPHISSLISEATSTTLRFAFDTVATDSTAAICVNSFASSPDDGSRYPNSSPAIYVSLLDPQIPQETAVTVEKRFFLGYSCWGSDFYFEGEIFPAVPADHDFGVKITHLAERLLQQGSLKNHPVSVNENQSNKGGLEGVLMGLDELRRGTVSGRKLVYTM